MFKENDLKEIKSAKDSNGGYVYVILTSDKTVKVGKTINPYKRFKQIENSSGKEIINWNISNLCANYSDIEENLHKKLKPYNLKGEWYDYSFEKISELLQKYKFEKVKYINSVDRCRQELKAVALVIELLKYSTYKEYNTLGFKYHLDKWDKNIEDINIITIMIQENIDYNKENYKEDEEFFNRDLYKYINEISDNENIADNVQEYCFDFVQNLNDPTFAKSVLVESGEYDLFVRILGIEEYVQNYVIEEIMKQILDDIEEEFSEELVFLNKNDKLINK